MKRSFWAKSEASEPEFSNYIKQNHFNHTVMKCTKIWRKNVNEMVILTILADKMYDV